MPSTDPLPTVQEFRQAFHDAVRGRRDKRADAHAGSRYDEWAGTGAIMWAREVARDKDLFQSVYFGTADGDALTYIGANRFGIPRILDAKGQGAASLSRPNAAAGAGTLWRGTRILVATSLAEPISYEIAADTPVGATDLVAAPPIQATKTGAGTAISIGPGGPRCIIDDPLWDNSWTVGALTCADGTDFEPAAAYRARIRQTRLSVRVGYEAEIISACLAAGATHVALFPSDASGQSNDYGINTVFVADQSFAGSVQLVRACIVALEKARVLGADLEVKPLFRQNLTVRAKVALWDELGSFDLNELSNRLTNALVQHFAPVDDGYNIRLDAMAGAMTAASAEVQSVSFILPAFDLPLYVGTPPGLPPTLTKYALAPTSVQFTFTGPT